MLANKKHKPSAKIWIEYSGKPLIGKGGSEILHAIDTEKSISKAAKKVSMSYRYVWNYISTIEKTLHQPIIETHRGGKTGGGGAKLTELGKALLKEYNLVEAYVGELLGDENYWEAVGLKISARNRFKGVVEAVEKGEVVAKIKIKVETPVTITALISTEAANELDIKPGDKVEAVVKATEVMVAKERD